MSRIYYPKDKIHFPKFHQNSSVQCVMCGFKDSLMHSFWLCIKGKIAKSMSENQPEWNPHLQLLCDMSSDGATLGPWEVAWKPGINWWTIICGLPPDEQHAVGMIAPSSLGKLTEALDLARATLEMHAAGGIGTAGCPFLTAHAATSTVATSSPTSPHSTPLGWTVASWYPVSMATFKRPIETNSWSPCASASRAQLARIPDGSWGDRAETGKATTEMYRLLPEDKDAAVEDDP